MTLYSHIKTLALTLFFLGSLFVHSSYAQNISIPEPIKGQGYHLVKNWDFSKITNGNSLREEFYTRYASANGTADHLHDEWEVYRDNNNHTFSNGALHLVARLPSNVLKVGNIESGMIRSKWTGKYGYYEARMKVPTGRGMWPAFWFANEWWPPEIDAVEIINNGKDDTTKSFHAVHGKFIGNTNFSRLNDDKSYTPGFDYSQGFHTFAIEWTPTSVKHYVDNILVVDRDFQWRHDNGAEGEPTPVVVNLAVGGGWPGSPTSTDEFPASLDVAYIRVWQK